MPTAGVSFGSLRLSHPRLADSAEPNNFLKVQERPGVSNVSLSKTPGARVGAQAVYSRPDGIDRQAKATPWNGYGDRWPKI